MIKGKSVFALIPARGGSKGLKKKNIKNLGGKPLIAWTITEATKSKYIDKLILSSDDKEIIKVAQSYGCEAPFVRPQELSNDESSSIDVLLHALKEVAKPYDYIVLLQPTSPLRLTKDIDQCLELCLKTGAPSCVSIVQSDKSPYWMFTLDSQKEISPIIKNKQIDQRRQDLPPAYLINGAVYVAKTNWLLKTKKFIGDNTIGYVMPKERSCDIDDRIDMSLCEILIKEQKKL